MRWYVLFAAFFILVPAVQARGQHVWADYNRNAPHTFSPDDPWTKGHVFRNHIGHGGKYHNCDGQEEKRYSPYIYWQGQNTIGCRNCPILHDIQCQWSEVKQRIRWGKGCDVPHYRVPDYPMQPYEMALIAEDQTSVLPDVPMADANAADALTQTIPLDGALASRGGILLTPPQPPVADHPEVLTIGDQPQQQQLPIIADEVPIIVAQRESRWQLQRRSLPTADARPTRTAQAPTQPERYR